ncbi:Nocturnin [Balamuthia mandrillaris]
MEDKKASLLPRKEGGDRAQGFSVLQWNTLADGLCDAHAFPHVDEAVLSWDYRRSMLLQEITRHSPDVICLEEVDHYDYFESALTEEGYNGLFKKKVGDGNDGCALFYKISKFVFASSDRFELLEEHRCLEYGNGSSQVAIVIVLGLKAATEVTTTQRPKVCVAMTHLKAKPGFEEQRYNQGMLLLEFVQSLFAKEEEKEKEMVPLVVVGDFNDVPSSLVCEYFRNGRNNPFQLKSAYSSYDNTGEEPYSTYKRREEEVLRTIDYIWYSHQTLRPCRLLEIPLPPALKFPQRLPAKDYPSDHLALAAEFIWL